MLLTYFTENFMTLMILLTLVSMLYVNREAKIPATKYFVVCIVIILAITVAGVFDKSTDVSGLAPDKATAVIRTRLFMSALAYMLRPCVILIELLIVLQTNKYRLLCIIPAVINAVIYATALFGSKIAFWIDANNSWGGGPLSKSVYITQFLFLLILLTVSVRAFIAGDKRKSTILILIFAQAVLVAVFEYNNISEYTNPITALCTLEYYIFLATIYRQELNDRLDKSVDEIGEAGIKLKTLTVEVMEALASAIDAKDEYTHGHSSRVAEYSRKLAEMNYKTEEECDEVFYAALLHDVGKIGIDDAIITKDGKLTTEEYDQIRQHPVYGMQILQRITEFPYLSIGAAGHHERYDGKGYPYGLKGTDIPEIARIISVADAYDAMTSKRSYRDPIPQQIVREELVKGAGTQFDPVYARLMLHLIDVDTEYEMSEREEVLELAGRDELVVDERRSECSTGILITPAMTTLHMLVNANEKTPDKEPVPSLILFDSLDSRVHENEKKQQSLNYFEYGELWFDGRVKTAGARKIKTETKETRVSSVTKSNEYRIEAVRIRDHALVRIIGIDQTFENIIALPDNVRFMYIGLTGEHCRLSHVSIDKSETELTADYIPRIAEEISYINVPAGDVPNVQVDGYRSDATAGVEITDGLSISFHTKNLPTARLVWHCPFVDIFGSDDGVVHGISYRDLAFLRFDGEAWECDPDVSMKLNVNTLETFGGWEAWKELNREGYDTVVTFRVEGNTITTITENGGISIKNTAVFNNINKRIYASITGDQVAITNIRISHGTAG